MTLAEFILARQAEKEAYYEAVLFPPVGYYSKSAAAEHERELAAVTTLSVGAKMRAKATVGRREGVAVRQRLAGWLRATSDAISRVADRLDPPIPCSDPRDEYGCPWDDHEHDPAEMYVVDGEWRYRLSEAERWRQAWTAAMYEPTDEPRLASGVKVFSYDEWQAIAKRKAGERGPDVG